MSQRDVGGVGPSSATGTDEVVDTMKRWAVARFREILRRPDVTDNFRRVVAGDFKEWAFRIEIRLNDEVRGVINDPASVESLSAERLI